MEIYIQFNKFELKVSVGFSEHGKSRVSLLLHFHISGEDSSNLSLHEGPGNVGAHQRTLLPAWTIDLSASALLFNALSGARETELVRRYGWALHKVGILQPLVAEGAAQGALAAREESGRLAGCTGSSPPVLPVAWPPTSLGPSLLWFIEEGEGGLLLFLRVVE